MRHGWHRPFVIDLSMYKLDLPQSQSIMFSCGRWKFPPFFRGGWEPPWIAVLSVGCARRLWNSLVISREGFREEWVLICKWLIIKQLNPDNGKNVDYARVEFCWLCKAMQNLSLNSSLLGQNGRHFADDIFRCVFVNEKFCILIKISLNFVPKGPIDNNHALVYITAWRWIGDKPLSEPMLTRFTDAYMRH